MNWAPLFLSKSTVFIRPTESCQPNTVVKCEGNYLMRKKNQHSEANSEIESFEIFSALFLSCKFFWGEHFSQLIISISSLKKAHIVYAIYPFSCACNTVIVSCRLAQRYLLISSGTASFFVKYTIKMMSVENCPVFYEQPYNFQNSSLLIIFTISLIYLLTF